ncbi:GIN domain-containing protein [Chloroflexota bacterium]
MKRVIPLILIVLVAIFSGCATNYPGQVVPATEFDKVEINSGFHVDIGVGEDYGVTLKVDEDILDDVEAVKDGDTLTIRVKLGHTIPRATTLGAEVTMPSLAALNLRSGSHVTVSGSGDDVTFDISGGSHADMGNFAAKNADLTATSGSHVTVNVSGKLDVKVSGGSHVTYKGEPQIGNIDISGGSTFSKQ